MKCPVCRDFVLFDHELEESLSSHRCLQCGGQWVEASRYWMWRDGQDGTERRMPDVVGHLSDENASRARLCPECGRLLRRAKVGRGVDFHLDRCGHCGGIWFDANEWETLRRHGLHDDVHFVFSAAWQAEVARQDRDGLHQKTLEHMLGSQDLAEIHRIKHWLGEHPRRAELLAMLITGSAGAMTKQ